MPSKAERNVASAATKTPVTDAITQTFSAVKPEIYLVHGDKGGVGKSFVASGLADTLSACGIPVAVADADTRNPDVIRMFDGHLPTIQVNLREEEGWMDLFDFHAKHPDHSIIISLPAGIGESMRQNFHDFCLFLRRLPHAPAINVLWLMNLEVDSINLLADAYESMGDFVARWYAVKNAIWTSGNNPAEYGLYDGSSIRKVIEQKGGQAIFFPALHKRIAQRLKDPECIMPYSQAMGLEKRELMGFTPSESIKLEVWFTEQVAKALAPIVSRHQQPQAEPVAG